MTPMTPEQRKANIFELCKTLSADELADLAKEIYELSEPDVSVPDVSVACDATELSSYIV